MGSCQVSRLFADELVLVADSSSDLQQALDGLDTYCMCCMCGVLVH